MSLLEERTERGEELETTYVPNLVSCMEPARRSHDELEDRLDVEGDGRRLSVLTKQTKRTAMSNAVRALLSQTK